MKAKNLVGFITVVFTLFCIYRLSFTFVSMAVESSANEYAKTENESVDFEKKQEYLNSLWKKPLYNILGSTFTYEDIKGSELCLGLDLQGGMYVTLELSVYELLKSFAKNKTENFYVALNTAKSKCQSDSNQKFLEIFYKEYKALDDTPLALIFGSTENSAKISSKISDQEVLKILSQELDNALDRSYDILLTRIDKFGTSQPNVQRITGTTRIQIELPGVNNPERVRKILQGVAHLGFWEVYTKEELAPYLEKMNDIDVDDEELKQSMSLFVTMMRDGRLVFRPQDVSNINIVLDKFREYKIFPNNLKWVWDAKSKIAPKTNEEFLYLHPLKSDKNGNPALDGSCLVTSKYDKDEFGRAYVSMQMNSAGAKSWRVLTSKNIGKLIAVTLDDKVYSAPVVNSEIPNGISQIQGNFTLEEADDLSTILKAGALPAPVSIVEEAIVGPSLGKESQGKALVSMLITIVAICGFMIAYYARAGFVSVCALLINLVFIFGILSQLGASLTMAGIAGLVLTIGMSIDANIIIFERIREELRKGAHIREAIKEGFRKSFSSIFDSNITTFLVGTILYLLGQGPIKGFATTLMIGIATSFFTSVYVTQYLFEVFVSKRGPSKMSFYFEWSKNLFTNINFNFVKHIFKAWTFSIVLIVSGLTIMIVKSGFNLGVDFTGGRSLVLSFEKAVNPEDFRPIIASALDNCSSEIKHYGSTNSIKITTSYLLNDDEEIAGPMIKNKIVDAIENSTDFKYSDDLNYDKIENAFTISNTTKVGPAVADSITKSAINSTLLALVMIFIYIFLRFRRWQLGAGALVALLHDVLMVFAMYGIFCLFNITLEIDQIFLAAILTIIGYSINDTVIIYDRYRELSDKKENDSPECVNNAINSTLSRTFITSATTLFAVIVLLIFGGESIRSFSVAMLIGVIYGTYSSICIALPLGYKLSSIKKS